jgi:hypothetical protein
MSANATEVNVMAAVSRYGCGAPARGGSVERMAWIFDHPAIVLAFAAALLVLIAMSSRRQPRRFSHTAAATSTATIANMALGWWSANCSMRQLRHPSQMASIATAYSTWPEPPRRH